MITCSFECKNTFSFLIRLWNGRDVLNGRMFMTVEKHVGHVLEEECQCRNGYETKNNKGTSTCGLGIKRVESREKWPIQLDLRIIDEKKEKSLINNSLTVFFPLKCIRYSDLFKRNHSGVIKCENITKSIAQKGETTLYF